MCPTTFRRKLAFPLPQILQGPLSPSIGTIGGWSPSPEPHGPNKVRLAADSKVSIRRTKYRYYQLIKASIRRTQCSQSTALVHFIAVVRLQSCKTG